MNELLDRAMTHLSNATEDVLDERVSLAIPQLREAMAALRELAALRDAAPVSSSVDAQVFGFYWPNSRVFELAADIAPQYAPGAIKLYTAAPKDAQAAAAQVTDAMIDAAHAAVHEYQSAHSGAADMRSHRREIMRAALEAVAPLLAQPAAREAEPVAWRVKYPGQQWGSWRNRDETIEQFSRDQGRDIEYAYATPPAQPDAPVSCGNTSCGSTEIVFTADGDMQCSKCGHPMSVSQPDAHAGEVSALLQEIDRHAQFPFLDMAQRVELRCKIVSAIRRSSAGGG